MLDSKSLPRYIFDWSRLPLEKRTMRLPTPAIAASCRLVRPGTSVMPAQIWLLPRVYTAGSVSSICEVSTMHVNGRLPVHIAAMVTGNSFQLSRESTTWRVERVAAISQASILPYCKPAGTCSFCGRGRGNLHSRVLNGKSGNGVNRNMYLVRPVQLGEWEVDGFSVFYF